MSVFQFQAAQALEIDFVVDDDVAMTVVDASDGTIFVAWFEVNENAGSTPNLTVDKYNGTTATYLGDDGGSTWVAKAVTAKQSLKFTQGYVIQKGSALRVTSSDSLGKFHVQGVAVRQY